MKAIYIAGPFRAPTAWGIENNIRRAEELGAKVAGIGGRVFPPGPDRISDWLGPEPAIRRGAHGLACGLDGGLPCLHWRADRLRACGNGVVPQQAALALLRLSRRANYHNP